MEWPSKNIPPGGVMHPAKARYSPDTHKFLKLLMDETKMTTMQRDKLNYFLRNGEPLPSLSRNSGRSGAGVESQNVPKVLIRPGSSKRRTRESIVQSGVYEREQFVPSRPYYDRDKEKQRLQDKMAFDKEIDLKQVLYEKIYKDKPHKEEDKKNRFDELMAEIKEREDWLKEMEELGEGSKHREIIQQQIQNKLREMECLKSNQSKKN